MSYQQQLKTYLDRNKLSFIYEEKTLDNNTFISRLIIDNIEYEWCVGQVNKKTAKQAAAKIALDKLNITEELIKNEESIKDILLDIRELLKAGL
tara:strand:- start:220 stop:501 length:282 start_codon:yes stop_codon:yes gene_type:complete